MSGSQHCSNCGTELEIDASLSGLCPACLLGPSTPGTDDPDDISTANLGQTHRRHRPFQFSSGYQFGPYRIDHPLGKGGMGEVYEAQDIGTGRRVALKILIEARNPLSDRERFLREGRLAAAVNHPHMVYVYASGQVAGTPFISMELVRGGTLKDAVQSKGVMLPQLAVAAALQVVTGLEAAWNAGILHRDVKPSNCFVDADGTIKIGDFGLSISALPRDGTFATIPGTILGTPQFAPPEQLRGDTLGVTGDIYSVGATLYYLLTGRAPFEDASLPNLIAAVLERPAVSPHDVRGEVPAGLADLVLRCLAKRTTDRYQSYAQLADALAPYGPEADIPARLGPRALAGAIDLLILVLAWSQVAWWTWEAYTGVYIDESTRNVLASITWLAFPIVYLGVCEGFWGCAVGKKLCNLRVVGPAGEPVGVRRALTRAALFTFAFAAAGATPLLYPLFQRWWSLSPWSSLPPWVWTTWIVAQSSLIFLVLVSGLFRTARSTNGYASLFDRLTNTRVVAARRLHKSALPTIGFESPPARADELIGPYLVIRMLARMPAGELLLGYDAILRRYVWIHRLPPGAMTLSRQRRDLARNTRLRWLSGTRTSDQAWDAYEALTGFLLATQVRRLHPWSAVRTWLGDLASECEAILGGSSPPTDLDVSRVWITADGRAKLLDFDVVEPGGAASGAGLSTGIDLQAAQTLLASMAQLVDRSTPYPRRVETFLRDLDGRQFASCHALRQEAETVAAVQTQVTRRTRLAHLALCCATVAVIGVFESMSGSWLLLAHSELSALRGSLAQIARFEFQKRPRDASALTTYVAGTFRNIIEEPRIWRSLDAQSTLTRVERQRAEGILATARPTAEDTQRAKAYLSSWPEGPFRENAFGTGWTSLLDIGVSEASRRMSGPVRWLGKVASLAVLALMSGLLFSGGLVTRLLGIDIVTRRGDRASRRRAGLRALLAWSPCVIFLAAWFDGRLNPFGSGESASAILLAVMATGAVWSVVDPRRGLHDRLAGTWLVPR